MVAGSSTTASSSCSTPARPTCAGPCRAASGPATGSSSSTPTSPTSRAPRSPPASSSTSSPARWSCCGRPAPRREHGLSGQRRAARAGPIELGVETSYWDVDGPATTTTPERRCAPSSTCSRPTPRPARPAGSSRSIVGRPERVAGRTASPTPQLVLADGTTHRARVRRRRTSSLPPDLPVGCHRARGSPADERDVDGRRRRRRRCRGRRRSPAAPGCSCRRTRCGSAASPLPSFAHLAALAGDGAPASALDVVVDAAAVRRVPRRAVRPQPVRAGRAGCTGTRSTSTTPRCRPPRRRRSATLIDWRELARRRRRQLLDAAARPRSVHPGRHRPLRRRPARRRRLRPLPRRHRRPGRRRPPGRARRAQPPARPVPRRPPARRRRGSRPRRPRPRPADRQPPRRLRDVGAPRSCSPPG